MCCSVLPLLVSLSPAFLFLLHLHDVTTTQGGPWEDYKHGRQGLEMHEKGHYCVWSCLLFTLQWPGGFCQSLYNESLCRIPPSIDDWTIHGLWPLRAMSCCDCWPIFHSDVQDLEAELDEHWPSLLKTKSSFQFWKEEWKKHGACAACVEGLNSPLRYFQICLKLRGRFDIHRLLEEAGVTPSCQTSYKAEEVKGILAPHLGDRHQLQCATDHKDREVWFQLKIHLSRNLTVGCNHHGDPASGSDPGPGLSVHTCPPNASLYYFPINHQQPWRPCG
ncbi:ribonuclease T2-like [Parambassis ranga]|uniref:Ribonuclease Oy-like n=1 Tax=Parambassis ranga TaxID=210632 RepID=A0A6P7JJ00_9TELE|nr:ribonuclease Oy-like [Parambassis ranga]XP_028275622.1 ribonuclease Oy-like [Parambassis ranga]